MGALKKQGFIEPLKEFIEVSASIHLLEVLYVVEAQHLPLVSNRDDTLQADRPFFGICLGLQLLFEGSEENGGVEGLSLVPGRVTKFEPELGLPVPHIGWNDLEQK